MDRRALVAAEVRAVVVEVCQRGGGSTDPALHLLEHASRLMSLQVSQGSGVSTSVVCPGAGPGDGGQEVLGQLRCRVLSHVVLAAGAGALEQ